MSTANNSYVLLPSLLDAINDDDIHKLEWLLSTDQGILDVAANTWPRNPLTLACDKRSFHVIAKIGSLKPGFVGLKIQDGYTVLHLACIREDLEMIMALLRLDSQLCFVEDEFSMIPLQTAAVHGRGNVIRKLLHECPESIEKLTAQNETVFHLTTKNRHSDAFEVLFEEAIKIGKEDLLDSADLEGNTVLHIAVLNQLLPVVRLLLPDPSSTTGDGFTIRVKARNKNGQTALDLYDIIPDPDIQTRWEIGRIIDRACHRMQRSNTPSSKLLETKNVLLVVLSLFIALAFSVTCGLPSFFPKESMVGIQVVFQLEDVISGELPLIFYIMSFITIFLTTSTGVLIWLLYSLPCRPLLILCGITAFIIYLLLAHHIMPKFFVRVGSHYVSSFQLMWMLALGVIFCVFLLWKCLLLHSYNFVQGLKRKLVSKLQSRTNKRLPRRNQSFGVQMVGTTIFATTSTPNN